MLRIYWSRLHNKGVKILEDSVVRVVHKICTGSACRQLISVVDSGVRAVDKWIDQSQQRPLRVSVCRKQDVDVDMTQSVDRRILQSIAGDIFF